MSHVPYFTSEYELIETTYKPDVEPEVPIYKRVLCGDNLFGNIFYPMWRDLDCVCCAMWRGIIVGAILTAITLFTAQYIMHMVP